MADLPFDCWCEIAGHLAMVDPLGLKRLRACSRVCRDAADYVVADRAYGEALVERIVDRLLGYLVEWANARVSRNIHCLHAIAPNFKAYDECWNSGWRYSFSRRRYWATLYLADLGRAGIRNIFSERGDPEVPSSDMCFCRLVNTCFGLALLMLSSTRAPELHLDAKLALEWAATYQRGGLRGSREPPRPRVEVLALLHEDARKGLELIEKHSEDPLLVEKASSLLTKPVLGLRPRKWMKKLNNFAGNEPLQLDDYYSHGATLSETKSGFAPDSLLRSSNREPSEAKRPTPNLPPLSREVQKGHGRCGCVDAYWPECYVCPLTGRCSMKCDHYECDHHKCNHYEIHDDDEDDDDDDDDDEQ